MTRYWTSEPKRIEDAPSPMWGCHVFVDHRPMALCQAYGRSYEEAHDQAHLIIAAMVAGEQALDSNERLEGYPAAQRVLNMYEQGKRDAQIAREKLTQAEQDASFAVSKAQLHCYDRYFDTCQTMNRIPKTFDQWKAGQHE